MQQTRRAMLVGAGVVGGASLATALLLRKLQPSFLTAPAQALPALHDIDDMRPLDRKPPMPAISFLDAAGRAHSLREFAGRGVVLNLWATWWGPCVAEMPSLATLARQLGSEAMVLPLSIDRGGAAAVQAFYADNHITGLGVWLDTGGRAEQALAVEGVPTTFVVDRQGRMAARLEGAADWSDDAALKPLRALIG